MSASPMCKAFVCVWSLAAATTASATQLQWKTLSEAVYGPPYPTTGRVQFEVGGEFLPAVQHTFIDVGLLGGLADGVEPQASLLGGDNGLGGLAGPQAGLALSVQTPIRNQLDMGLLIEAFGDGSVRQGAVMQDFHFNEAGFDLAFDLLPGDGSVRKHFWQARVADGQPFQFTGAGTEVLGDGSVRVLFGLLLPAGVHVPGAPVVEFSARSVFVVPEPAAGLLLAVGALGLRRRSPAGRA